MEVSASTNENQFYFPDLRQVNSEIWTGRVTFDLCRESSESLIWINPDAWVPTRCVWLWKMEVDGLVPEHDDSRVVSESTHLRRPLSSGFKLNNKLYQMLVARYADNEVIDFDNFTCCLVKLEAMFSTYTTELTDCIRFIFHIQTSLTSD